MKYREIEYYRGEYCDSGRKFCEHCSPMGWCECEEECDVDIKQQTLPTLKISNRRVMPSGTKKNYKS